MSFRESLFVKFSVSAFLHTFDYFQQTSPQAVAFLSVFPQNCALFLHGRALPCLFWTVHCSLCSLIGILKSPDIFVLHLKRELRWAIEGLFPEHFNIFFSWFLEVGQGDWKDGKVREWIERLLTVPRLLLWGTSGNNVLTVSQGAALLMWDISVLSRLFFPNVSSLFPRKPLQWNQF